MIWCDADALGRGVLVMGKPLSTASTAAWHWAQFPDHIKPTEPSTGFTIRPHASYNNDLNIARVKEKRRLRNQTGKDEK